MVTTFTIEFKEHLSTERTSHLKGILLFKGTGRDEGRGFVLEVHRENRVSFTAITLNNWKAAGWLTWESDPELSQETGS